MFVFFLGPVVCGFLLPANIHGPFSVLYPLFLSMLVFLLTLLYIKTSNSLGPLLLLPTPRSLSAPSWLTSITIEPRCHCPSLWMFFHGIINPLAPWSFCPIRSSQQIPSLGSIYHQFSQLLPLIIQVIKENHTIMWTSANSNFGLLLQLYSQEVIILIVVLPCLIPSLTSLGNKSNPMAFSILHFHWLSSNHFFPSLPYLPSSLPSSHFLFLSHTPIPGMYLIFFFLFSSTPT